MRYRQLGRVGADLAQPGAEGNARRSEEVEELPGVLPRGEGCARARALYEPAQLGREPLAGAVVARVQSVPITWAGGGLIGAALLVEQLLARLVGLDVLDAAVDELEVFDRGPIDALIVSGPGAALLRAA